jgi:hypothetical protein
MIPWNDQCPGPRFEITILVLYELTWYRFRQNRLNIVLEGNVEIVGP